MLSATEIVRNAIRPTRTRGVYFLIYEGVIVYVGQSGHVEFRIISHANGDKVFDSYTVIDCQGMTQGELNDTEADYIVEYEPIYNHGIPPNSKWVTLKILKVRTLLTLPSIKRFIRQQRIRDKNGYYLWSDLAPLGAPHE